MAMRPSRFIFYLEWLRTMDDATLNKAERSRLIDAIVSYADTGNIPELPRLLMAIFSPIKATLDRDAEKYEKKAAAVRENGKKGGRPKGIEKPNETNENQPKPTETKTRNNINIDINTDNNILYPSAPEDEKKIIFEIFFWRNFVDPQGETTRFYEYNTQRKWKALNTTGKRLNSATNDWQPINTNPRVKQQFLDMWLAMYNRIRTTEPEIAAEMIDAGSKCLFNGSKAVIYADKKVRDYILQNRPPEIMAYIGNFQLTTSQS